MFNSVDLHQSGKLDTGRKLGGIIFSLRSCHMYSGTFKTWTTFIAHDVFAQPVLFMANNIWIYAFTPRVYVPFLPPFSSECRV
jgi:hypothetical protein